MPSSTGRREPPTPRRSKPCGPTRRGPGRPAVRTGGRPAAGRRVHAPRRRSPRRGPARRPGRGGGLRPGRPAPPAGGSASARCGPASGGTRHPGRGRGLGGRGTGRHRRRRVAPGGSLAAWLGSAGPGTVGITRAEAVTWATRLFNALEWARLGAGSAVGPADEWWDCPGNPAVCLPRPVRRAGGRTTRGTRPPRRRRPGGPPHDARRPARAQCPGRAGAGRPGRRARPVRPPPSGAGGRLTGRTAGGPWCSRWTTTCSSTRRPRSSRRSAPWAGQATPPCAEHRWPQRAQPRRGTATAVTGREWRPKPTPPVDKAGGPPRPA